MNGWWQGLLLVWRHFFFGRKRAAVAAWCLVGLSFITRGFMVHWYVGLVATFTFVFVFPAIVWRMDYFRKKRPGEAGSLRHLGRTLNPFEPYQGQ